MRRRAAARADLRLVLRPVPRRHPQHPRRGRRAAPRDEHRVRRAATTTYQVDEVGYNQLRQVTEHDRCRPGEVGYVVANVRGVQETRAGDTIFDADHRAASALPGYRDIQSMVFAGIYPDRREAVRRAARRAREAAAQRRLAALRAGVVDGAGLRVPLRVPGPPAHGDRAGAAGARVRPRPHHHRAERGVPRLQDRRRHGARSRIPRTMPHGAGVDRIEEPFVKARILAPADYIGAIMTLGHGAARRVPDMQLPRRRAASNSTSSFRWREIILDFYDKLKTVQPRLRLARLRVPRLPRERAGEARHAASTAMPWTPSA